MKHMYWLLIVLAMAIANIARAQEQGQKPERVIRANAIVLEDDQRRERAKLWMYHGYPTLALTNEEGRALLVLQVTEVGPIVRLNDADGECYLSLDEWSLVLTQDHKIRAILGVSENGANLEFYDERCRPIWEAP
jgi:hypothetical protein